MRRQLTLTPVALPIPELRPVTLPACPTSWDFQQSPDGGSRLDRRWSPRHAAESAHDKGMF